MCDVAVEGQYSTALEDTEVEGQHFKADSWSLAVDRTYLQKHHRATIKRQDVIYGNLQMLSPHQALAINHISIHFKGLYLNLI